MYGVELQTRNRCSLNSIATVVLGFLLLSNVCRLTVAVEDICATCQCNLKRGFLNLHCSHRQLTDFLSEYPSLISSEQAIDTFNLIYDDNPMHQLSALPATSRRVYLSCRLCAIHKLVADAFAAVPYLEHLDLSENALTSEQLTADVFQGASIIGLVLSANRIEHLSTGLFANISRLRHVDLSGNRLTQLTAVLAAMPIDLHSLDVSSNLLLSADDDTANSYGAAPLPRLQDLNVWNNSFTHVPAVIRRLGATLIWLDMGGGCCLHNVSGVRDLPELRTLIIHSTNVAAMQHIEGTAFGGLGRLKHFRIVDNPHLHTLNITGLLSSAATLHRFDVSGNALTSVQLNAAGSTAGGNGTVLFDQLLTLRLENNPWHCDCDLYRTLVQLMPRNKHFDVDLTARCSSPPVVASDFLVELLLEPEPTECAVRKVIETPAIVRPRMKLVTMLSVLAVVMLGLVIGFGIVYVPRMWRNNLSGGGVDAAGGGMLLRESQML